MLNRRREHEARDRIAVRQQRFNQRLKVGHVCGGDLEKEVIAAREVVTLAYFFERLYVLKQSVVVLTSATHADESRYFQAESFAVNMDCVASDNPDFLHLPQTFGCRRG